MCRPAFPWQDFPEAIFRSQQDPVVESHVPCRHCHNGLVVVDVPEYGNQEVECARCWGTGVVQSAVEEEAAYINALMQEGDIEPLPASKIQALEMAA